MIHAVRFYPYRRSHLIRFGPKFRNLKTSFMKPWESVSKALAMSTAITPPPHTIYIAVGDCLYYIDKYFLCVPVIVDTLLCSAANTVNDTIKPIVQCTT